MIKKNSVGSHGALPALLHEREALRGPGRRGGFIILGRLVNLE